MDREEPIRVLVADDHAVVRQGVAAIIGTDRGMTLVAEAKNGREAVELFRRERPHVGLIDLKMPELDGVGTITAIRAEFPLAALIVLTTYEREAEITRSVQAGAQGYLLKAGPPKALLAAIRAAHQGQRYFAPEVAEKLAEHVMHPELTEREMEVLRLLATGKTNREAGEVLFITEGTVKAHVNNILTKMKVRDRMQAVTTALKRGLVQLD